MRSVLLRAPTFRHLCVRFRPVQVVQHRAVCARAASVEDFDTEGVERLLPPTVQRRLTKLRELQMGRKDLDFAYWKEKLQLEKKFESQFAVLQLERFEIVKGAAAVPDYGIEDDAEDKDEGIPDFWLTAMSNHPVLESEISDSDAEVLSFLEDVRSEVLLSEDEQLGGFGLRFTFKQNPYFTNTELQKTYLLEMGMNAPYPKEITGCKINWLPGKDVTVKEVTKKVKTGKGKVIVQKHKEPIASFFNFFNPPVLPEEPELEEDESLQELQNELDKDFEIGLAFKEDLVGDAVLWFTGEATPENYDDFGGEEGEFDGEYDEDEAFADVEDEKPSKGKAGKSASR